MSATHSKNRKQKFLNDANRRSNSKTAASMGALPNIIAQITSPNRATTKKTVSDRPPHVDLLPD